MAALLDQLRATEAIIRSRAIAGREGEEDPDAEVEAVDLRRALRGVGVESVNECGRRPSRYDGRRGDAMAFSARRITSPSMPPPEPSP